MKRVENSLGWYFDDWSEFELRLVIRGPPLSWKNHRQLTVIAGKPRLVLSKAHKKWAHGAVVQLMAQWGSKFSGPLPKKIPLNAAIVSYLPTRRLTDASNLYQGPEDVMQACHSRCKPTCRVHAGVIEDDCAIETHNGSARRYDKDNPRVEIVLTRSYAVAGR